MVYNAKEEALKLLAADSTLEFILVTVSTETFDVISSANNNTLALASVVLAKRINIS